MNAEKMTAAIRPRNDWEAVDLGLTLVQSNARSVYAAWAAGALPAAAAAVALALATDRLWPAFLAFWAVRPLLARLPLHVLSRALFGEHDRFNTLLRRVPALLFGNAPLSALTISLLNPVRSFTLPVVQLEGLRRGARKSRSALLLRDSAGVAVLVTILCRLFALTLFATFALVLQFVAPDFVSDDLARLFDGTLSPAREAFYLWLTFGLFVVAESIMEPICCACGFALYLNRRTRLEGWDIELAFRRLAARRHRAPGAALPLAVAMLAIVAGTVVPLTLQARDAAVPVPPEPATVDFDDALHDKETIEAAIERVLAQREFDLTETRTEWVPRRDDAEPVPTEDPNALLARIGAVLAVVSEFAIWIVVAVLAALAFRYRHVWVGAARNALPASAAADIAPMPVIPQPLAGDVPGKALSLWHAGDRTAALSLLYRGAVARVSRLPGIDLTHSSTEQDCIRAVTGVAETELADYFSAIARAWQALAYAGIAPDGERMNALCSAWHARFGDAA